MFSRFFKTSQPFHYLMGVLTLAIGGTALLWGQQGEWHWDILTATVGLPLVLLITQFIVIKNEITGQNSFLLYAGTMLLLAILPALVTWKEVIVLLLLLMSLRRLLSLKSVTRSLSKIFDATLWVCIAGLIAPIALLFLLVVYTAIFLFVRNKWRHWTAPLLAIIAVGILSLTLDLYVGTHTFFSLWDTSSYAWNFLWSQELTSLWMVWLYSSAAVFGILVYIIKLVDIQQRVRPRFSVLVIFGLCALILATLEQPAYAIALAPVLAIFLVRSIETIQHKVWREILFLIPVTLVLLALVFL